MKVTLSNEAKYYNVFFDNVVVKRWTAPLSETTDYTAGGLDMKMLGSRAFGRLENKSKFVSQELDNDFDIDLYQFRYRNHNPQIGRFIEIDPLATDYAHNSTYAYAENRVVDGIDLEGLEWYNAVGDWFTNQTIIGFARNTFNTVVAAASINGDRDAQISVLSFVGSKVNEGNKVFTNGTAVQKEEFITTTVLDGLLAIFAPKFSAESKTSAAVKTSAGAKAEIVASEVEPLTPQTYGELRAQGAKDSHHIIQDAAVKEIPGYSRQKAPAVQLEGPSNVRGTQHYKATQVQRQAGGGTYGAERRIGYKALRTAGLSVEHSKALIIGADIYFKTLGIDFSSVLRIPGKRK